ncbi:hypothetical protein D3C76_206480 [compost metagenome]
MKKKVLVGLGVVVLTLGIGTAAFAAGDGPIQNWSFEDMLPHMKQVHPDFTDQQLKDMYQSCHNNGQAGVQKTGSSI